MNNDPYDTVAWQNQLRNLAEDFLRADDALKQANIELKPYHQARKTAKEGLLNLMAKHRYPVIPFEERNESLMLVNRISKKKPTEEQLEERCHKLFRNSQTDSAEVIKFLFKKVEEPVSSLTRKKLAAAAAAAQEENDQE